jgi:peroxiredoxin
MAALDSLHKEFGESARVIGVSVDQGSIEKVRRFAESNDLHFAIAHDPGGEIQSTYQVVGVPTTFVIGRDGRLVWQHTGNIADDFREVHSAVVGAVELR